MVMKKIGFGIGLIIGNILIAIAKIENKLKINGSVLKYVKNLQTLKKILKN